MAENLVKSGHTVELHERFGRSRAGKGGPKPKPRVIESYSAELRKEKQANSKADAGAAKVLGKAGASARRPPAK